MVEVASSTGPCKPAAFREIVLAHYRRHGRDLPWRRTRAPYAIVVSEVMLQQTQVSRVLPKYEQFLATFPTVFSLAEATIADVLSIWQGLGYNRRALALHRTAGFVAGHQGIFPRTPVNLARLPGIGPATAAAVCVFAYDMPLPFIETNIRSAMIHHFFLGQTSVSDSELLPLVEATLDRADPRRWYYALMDYGAWVKKTYGNPGRRSRHHAVQSRFAGSHRQLRAMVLRCLLSAQPAALSLRELKALLPDEVEGAVIRSVAEELVAEGFLRREEDRYRIAASRMADDPPRR